MSRLYNYIPKAKQNKFHEYISKRFSDVWRGSLINIEKEKIKEEDKK